MRLADFLDFLFLAAALAISLLRKLCGRLQALRRSSWLQACMFSHYLSLSVAFLHSSLILFLVSIPVDGCLFLLSVII